MAASIFLIFLSTIAVKILTQDGGRMHQLLLKLKLRGHSCKNPCSANAVSEAVALSVSCAAYCCSCGLPNAPICPQMSRTRGKENIVGQKVNVSVRSAFLRATWSERSMRARVDRNFERGSERAVEWERESGRWRKWKEEHVRRWRALCRTFLLKTVKIRNYSRRVTVASSLKTQDRNG